MLTFIVNLLVFCSTFAATFALDDLWVNKQPSVKLDSDNSFAYLPGMLILSIGLATFACLCVRRWLKRKHG